MAQQSYLEGSQGPAVEISMCGGLSNLDRPLLQGVRLYHEHVDDPGNDTQALGFGIQALCTLPSLLLLPACLCVHVCMYACMYVRMHACLFHFMNMQCIHCMYCKCRYRMYCMSSMYCKYCKYCMCCMCCMCCIRCMYRMYCAPYVLYAPYVLCCNVMQCTTM